MKRLTSHFADQVSPYIEEIGRNDAQVDARAGNQDRYTIYLALLSEGGLCAPNWQLYRAAYEAEQARLAEQGS
ncbi:MAG TPA: hypothetical protein VHB98_04745 [Chloroflexota bacterium]|jgi:hypothetical protein|nr:hypothetical protein [Chloroflexota bacterium]